MILGPVNGIDCVAFVVFLVPQLLYQADLGRVLIVVIKVLPFLICQLPYQLVRERYYTTPQRRSPFTRQASLFQDVVIRCVRYAFANIPASVGRVFFSKGVAYPFFRFRLLRHGYLHCPLYYQEVVRQGVCGLWICDSPAREPDIIIFYAHGGGFSMGSAYFYIEFLMAWMSRLKASGFTNPAVFALEYSLVPDAQWPVQFNETRAAYAFLRETLGPGSAAKMCVSGDSAGGTLILSMLLQLGQLDPDPPGQTGHQPGLAVLLSPWTHLISPLNRNTPSDYLDRDSLHLYAHQYGGEAAQTDPVISPGLSTGRWKQAAPLNGYRIVYGADEVFRPGIQQTVDHIKKSGAVVKTHEQAAGIHAWPVVDLFLGDSRAERLRGLDVMTEFVMASSLASSLAIKT